MKQVPDWQRVQANLRPGAVTLQGFLGDDGRDLVQIIDEDDATVRRLGLTHAQIQLNDLLAGGVVVRRKRTDLFEDAQSLFPVEALHVDIRHALEDVSVPIAAGIPLLDDAQGGGVGFACHIQLSQTVIDGGQFKIFVDGFVDLTARHQLIDQAVAGAHVHG